MTAGPHRDRSISPQNTATSGTIGVAIRYPMSVATLAGRSPPASLATMMPTWTSSKISRTPTAARRGTFILRFRAVISSAYPASARPATIIVVETAPFTDDMLLRFVVTSAGPAVRPPGSRRAGPRCASADCSQCGADGDDDDPAHRHGDERAEEAGAEEPPADPRERQ